MTEGWASKYTREQLIAFVRRLAGQRMSSAKIAKAIGLGVTKNMVISIAYNSRPRIELMGSSRNGHSPSPLRPRLRTAAKNVGRIAQPTIGVAHFDDLQPGDRRCRFPLWPDRMLVDVDKSEIQAANIAATPKLEELFFCGKRAVAGSSWCLDCAKKVYTPLPARTPARPFEPRHRWSDAR